MGVWIRKGGGPNTKGDGLSGSTRNVARLLLLLALEDVEDAF